MRLSEYEKQEIIAATRALDPHSKIYLFGSRINPNLKGGDLDLLVISEVIDFSKKITLLIAIKKQIRDQKIDLLVKNSEQASQDPFVKSILPDAVELK
jgi:uncharacterized protein